MPVTQHDQDSAAEQLSQTSGRLALVIGRLNRRMLRATEGLSHGSLSALSSIVKFGPLRLNELAGREAVAAATITRIATDLEVRGYVTRESDPLDRRAITIAATESGVDYIVRARSARADVIAALLGTLNARELELVQEALPVFEALVLEAHYAGKE